MIPERACHVTDPLKLVLLLIQRAVALVAHIVSVQGVSEKKSLRYRSKRKPACRTCNSCRGSSPEDPHPWPETCLARWDSRAPDSGKSRNGNLRPNSVSANNPHHKPSFDCGARRCRRNSLWGSFGLQPQTRKRREPLERTGGGCTSRTCAASPFGSDPPAR